MLDVICYARSWGQLSKIFFVSRDFKTSLAGRGEVAGAQEGNKRLPRKESALMYKESTVRAQGEEEEGTSSGGD